MKRRTFIAGLGSAAAWPVVARIGFAQSTVPVVGFLFAQSANTYPQAIDAFRQGLSGAGFTEGRNVLIEYRWAENHYDRLPALAADLVARKVSVIVAAGGGQSPLAVKPLTVTIPIVFTMGDLDPVRAGVIESLNHPGGNITGVIPLISLLGPKRLELLHEMVPKAKNIAMLSNPTHTDAAQQVSDMQQAARRLGLDLIVFNANSESDIDTAFTTMAREHAEAVIMAGDLYLAGRRTQVVALAAQYRLPVMYGDPTAIPRADLSATRQTFSIHIGNSASIPLES